MKKLAVLLCCLLPWLAYGQTAINAVVAATQRLGIAGEFDPKVAKLEKISEPHDGYQVSTPRIIALYRLSDNRVTRIVRRKAVAPVKAGEPRLSWDALRAKADALVDKLGGRPKEYSNVGYPHSGVLYDVEYRPTANGITSKYGVCSVRFDQRTGEFLVVQSMVEDDIHQPPGETKLLGELQPLARSALVKYNASLPRTQREGRLPMPELPDLWSISYGYTLPKLRDGRKVRVVVYEANYAGVNVILDASTGKTLEVKALSLNEARASSLNSGLTLMPLGIEEPGASIDQPEGSIVTPEAIEEKSQTSNSLTHNVLLIGGAMAAIIAAIALVLRKRA